MRHLWKQVHCVTSLWEKYVTDSKAGGVIPSKSFDSEAPDNNKHESLGHGLALLDFGLLLVESFLIVFSFGMAMRVFCHLMLDVSNFFFDFSNDHSELIIFVSQETLHFWRVFSCLWQRGLCNLNEMFFASCNNQELMGTSDIKRFEWEIFPIRICTWYLIGSDKGYWRQNFDGGSLSVCDGLWELLALLYSVLSLLRYLWQWNLISLFPASAIISFLTVTL